MAQWFCSPEIVNRSQVCVSDAGMVYMSGLQQNGNLNVQWGKSAAQQCNASFTLPVREGKPSGISQIETVCR